MTLRSRGRDGQVVVVREGRTADVGPDMGGSDSWGVRDGTEDGGAEGGLHDPHPLCPTKKKLL